MSLPTQPADSVRIYQIRVEGHLDARWSSWFDGLTLTCYEDGTMDLVGPITDQAALYGLLIKIRDLGLSLLSVNPIESDPFKSKSTSP